jgi:UPF0755 protein
MKDIFRDREIYLVVGLFLFVIFSAHIISAPSNYPEHSIISVEKGFTLNQVSESLESTDVIRSKSLFKVFVALLGTQSGVKAGDYYLHYRESSLSLAWRVVQGKHNIDEVKVTIPEGFNNQEIADLFDEEFPLFDDKKFLTLSLDQYLFPDTYFVKVSARAEDVIEILNRNFEDKIHSVQEQLDSSKHTMEEIIIMASLIEGEVQTKEDKEIVSGILWKRLSIGMALQVDSAPITYEEPGLPERSINNPGLVSIEAALNPKSSPYLYFISDKEGKTHYARTLDEHIQNIQKYL